jgi:hypothetical protein
MERERKEKCISLYTSFIFKHDYKQVERPKKHESRQRINLRMHSYQIRLEYIKHGTVP